MIISTSDFVRHLSDLPSLLPARAVKNPTLSDLVGGVQGVTLGDEEAKTRGTQKSVLERRGPATFPVVVEMRNRSLWVAHETDKSVDEVLKGKMPFVQVGGKIWCWQLAQLCAIEQFRRGRCMFRGIVGSSTCAVHDTGVNVWHDGCYLDLC